MMPDRTTPARTTRPRPATAWRLAAAALLGSAPPCAAAAPEAAAVILPWGGMVVAAAQAATSLLVPVAITAATAALARIAGPLRVLVTAALVERLVRNVGDYAVNAVDGAVRDRVLTVPVGAAVIARAVQRALDQAPAWLVAAAGGPEGVAEKVFRSLPLEAAATAANTLAPALSSAQASRPAPPA